MSGLGTIAGVLAIMCFLVLVPALYSLVEIISLYEIVQDSLRNTSAIIIIISLIVLYGCLASFVFTVHLISSTGLTIILILNLVVGLLMVPVQAFGFLGAERESERLLLTYKSLAKFTGPIALLIGTVTLASSSFIVASYVNDNCRALTQKLPADFLRSMPQGAGCQKYYGNALRLDAEGVHYLDPDVPWAGWETWCVNKSDRVYAWEYATRTDGCDALYGCLNAYQKAAARANWITHILQQCYWRVRISLRRAHDTVSRGRIPDSKVPTQARVTELVQG